MLVKHDLVEPEESPRAQKRASSAISSDPSSSPVFSATATSPATASNFFSLPQLDPAAFAIPDLASSNYSTSKMPNALGTLDELDDGEEMLEIEKMEKLTSPLESVEDHNWSETPVKTTALNAFGIDMAEVMPYSTASQISQTLSSSKSNSSRQEMYRQYFADKEVELQKLRVPELDVMFQNCADEVLQAYLLHTRFSVNVWANYDSVEKLLFIRSDQLASCGKLSLFPTQYQRFERLDPSVYQFTKVRVNIGTPFRNLFTMDIDCVPSKGPKLRWELDISVRAVPDPVRGPHHLLKYVVDRASKSIEEDGIVKGQHGLTFRDLEVIALEFTYKAKNNVTQKPSFGYRAGGGFDSIQEYSTSHIPDDEGFFKNKYAYFNSKGGG